MTAIEELPQVLDELLQRIDEAQNALGNAPYVGLRRANCRLADDRIVLSGSVSSFYLKQMAQTLTLQVLASAIPIDNQLEVECAISTDLELIGEKSVSCRI